MLPAHAAGGKEEPVHEDAGAVVVGVIGQHAVPLVLLFTGAVPGAAEGQGAATSSQVKTLSFRQRRLTCKSPGGRPAQTPCCWGWPAPCRCCCSPRRVWSPRSWTRTRQFCGDTKYFLNLIKYLSSLTWSRPPRGCPGTLPVSWPARWGWCCPSSRSPQSPSSSPPGSPPARPAWPSWGSAWSPGAPPQTRD